MQIFDSDNNLIAVHIKNEIQDSKNFLTDINKPFQIGTFKMMSGEKIERHYHNPISRIIESTSEALFVLEGTIKVELYDKNLTFINDLLVSEKEVVVLFSGGHYIEVLENCKFIEIKQGPYNELKDKFQF